ncbi:hypothetical protein RRG08_046187 [Elysia crispata]|uniref:Uncharacterized protein n=1 Tax=Elysia crispata TaxID=231223 RepID=A0AAE0XNA4_9GAST|nr:hypothetical protein RRG08_046187 [Elysia crispata]
MFGHDFTQPPPGLTSITNLPNRDTTVQCPMPISSLGHPTYPVLTSPVVPIRTPSPVRFLVPTQTPQRSEMWPLELRLLLENLPPLDQRPVRNLETDPMVPTLKVSELEQEQFKMASKTLSSVAIAKCHRRWLLLALVAVMAPSVFSDVIEVQASGSGEWGIFVTQGSSIIDL